MAATRVILFAVALAAVLGACSPAASPQAHAGRAALPRPASSVLARNVTRADYAGSAACARCHGDIAAAWARSPMHRMTRDLPDAAIRAPFDGRALRFKGDRVTLERRAGQPFVRVEPEAGGATDYRVTRVIGGRTREDFVGVDAALGGPELVLPVSFVFGTQSLRYKGYSVMVHERGTLRAGPVWSATCIFCHNTVPEMDRLLGAVAGAGAPAYQGELVDRLLPADRRAHVVVTDARAFGRDLGDELARWTAHGRGEAVPAILPEPAAAFADSPEDPNASRSAARRAIVAMRSSFAGADLVETGIGCEACHGGARAHAEDPRVLPSLSPLAPWLRVDLPAAARPIVPEAARPERAPPAGGAAAAGGGDAATANRVCARCHQVLFSRYPYTWEGGRRDEAPGGSHISSGEARDFMLGACATAMACTACHDPHGGSDRDALRALAKPAGNGACTRCHTALASASAVRAHAHHDPQGAGASCVACHMPRKNMGLDGTLTRYHRIGAPTDPARVLGDRPLECALCHADRSVRALIDAMQAWWPVRYPTQRLEELYGSLDENVMLATLERGKPHEKAVAMAVLGEDRVRAAAPALGRELLDDYPLVREWALRALQRLAGKGQCVVDLAAADESIAAEAASSCDPLKSAAPPARVAAPRSLAPAATGGSDEAPED